MFKVIYKNASFVRLQEYSRFHGTQFFLWDRRAQTATYNEKPLLEMAILLCIMDYLYPEIYTDLYIYIYIYIYIYKLETLRNWFLDTHSPVGFFFLIEASLWMGCFLGLMANVLNSSLEINEFELQSRNYVHFRTNTLGKAMKPHYLLSYM